MPENDKRRRSKNKEGMLGCTKNMSKPNLERPGDYKIGNSEGDLR